MSDKLRWGFLSTAGINNRVIGPLKSAGRSELVAVASRDMARARAYAQENEIPKAHGSYEALLADPEIDAIYNPLPNTMHAEWTIKAAEAGKHILCEKPITVTMTDFERMVNAAADNNVILFEAFMYLHQTQTRTVLEMIQDGKLGQLQLVNSWFNFYLPAERTDNIRLSKDLSGGSLWDVGVYPNSLAVTIAGGVAPSEVYGDQIIGESGVDVATRAQLKFSDGLVAQISSGFRTPPRAAAHIIGDAGTVILDNPWFPGANGDTTIQFIPRRGEPEPITIPAKNPYLCEIEAMEACVLDGAAPVLPLSHSRAFLQSALAIIESARTGQVVRL